MQFEEVKKMSKERIYLKDKQFLRVLRGGALKRSALTKLLEVSNPTFQRIYKRMEKYGYVEKPSYSYYNLTDQGRNFFEHNPEVTFGTPKFQKYLKQFPEIFQAVIRQTLCSIVAKQTKIFDKFTSGYCGVILAGSPKIGKTPLGEIICELIGLDPVTHKLDVQLVTVGEIRGRSRGRAGFDTSPWFSKVISILDEVDKILNASTSEVAKFLAHSDKFYIRENEKRIHSAVPFLTLNVSGSTKEVIEKIEGILGVEYIKRNAVCNVNAVKRYIPNSYLFFRKVCKDYPRIDFKPRILKDEITDQEAGLIASLLKRAIKSDKEAFYDERGIEIQALCHYSLSGGQNFESSIYSVIKDRLLLLETLEAVNPEWRESFFGDWEKHEAIRSPEAEQILKKEELERQKLDQEIKQKQKEIKKTGEDNREKADNLVRDWSGEEIKARKMRADLRLIAGTEKDRAVITVHLERYRKNKTPERLTSFRGNNQFYQKLVDSRLAKHREKQARAERIKEQNKRDREERKAILRELDQIASELWRNWRGNQKSDDLRLQIRGAIKAQAKNPLWQLREWLVEAREKRQSLKRNEPEEDYSNFKPFLGLEDLFKKKNPSSGPEEKKNPPGQISDPEVESSAKQLLGLLGEEEEGIPEKKNTPNYALLVFVGSIVLIVIVVVLIYRKK